jgi:hypothetical protein
MRGTTSPGRSADGTPDRCEYCAKVEGELYVVLEGQRGGDAPSYFCRDCLFDGPLDAFVAELNDDVDKVAAFVASVRRGDVPRTTKNERYFATQCFSCRTTEGEIFVDPEYRWPEAVCPGCLTGAVDRWLAEDRDRISAYRRAITQAQRQPLRAPDRPSNRRRHGSDPPTLL